MLKAYISSNGCEDGRLASAFVEQFFRMNNLTITRDSTQADLIVFYACGLTEQTENDSLRVIRKLQSRMKPSARLIVWGCLPQIDPQSLKTVYDGPLIGPKDISFFEGILEKPKTSFNEISANTLAPKETFSIKKNIIDRLYEYIHACKYRFTFYIQVAAGCTGHCTYCTERCAKGRINSRPIEKIISEFKRGLQMGYKRFFLVADDLGSYGRDIGCTLPDLLGKMIRTDDKRNYKIILNQIEPSYLKELFSDLEEIFDSGKVEYVGCPVQSGSERILKLMGRMYTVDDWKLCMRRINNKFPKIHLNTHLMVGFPTETDKDFEATLKLLDEIFLDEIGIFKFSKRPCVYASYIPGQISEKIKELRYRRLRSKAELNQKVRKIQRLMNFSF